MVQILLVLLICFPYIINGFQSFNKFPLPATGSEAYAFDPSSAGPYTGLNDGRIVKYQGPKLGFVDFATTTSTRTKKKCDGTDGNDMKLSMTCGRPIGLEFNQKTGDLYVVDAYQGLMVIGKDGGVAKKISGGMHFDFADGIDVDQNTGIVYVSDLGDILSRNQNMTDILLKADDRSGRLLRCDPTTQQCTVLLTGLAMPAGLAVSKDGSFVLVGEYLLSRIKKYWIKGPKANTSEILVDNLPGNPDNIKRAPSGDFWAAINIQKLHPKLTVFPLGQKISANGQILETVNFYGEYNATYIAEVQEYYGNLYVASIVTNFAGVYAGTGC